MRGLLLTTCLGVLTAAEAGYDRYITGSSADVDRKPAAGLLLSGGGGDVPAAIKWFVNRAASGDIVVLRASGTDSYNQTFMAADSVETFVIKSPDAGADPALTGAIRNAEGLFFAGGDQWNYVNRWKGPIAEAIQAAYRRGAAIGGSSAGLAILGEYSFSAEHDSVRSAEALADPFNKRVTIERDFLHFGALKGIITDSHFSERDRMGRLLVFLARVGDGRGIGIDEGTAVLVEPDGSARVEGKGAAFFVRIEGRPGVCKPGTPLDGARYAVYRVPAGSGSFNTVQWSGTGGTSYKLQVSAGVISSDKAGGSLY